MVNACAPDRIILTGELFKIYKDPVQMIESSVAAQFKDTGFIKNFSHAQLEYRDLGTDMASLGVCFEMIRNDWGYYRE